MGVVEGEKEGMIVGSTLGLSDRFGTVGREVTVTVGELEGRSEELRVGGCVLGAVSDGD